MISSRPVCAQNEPDTLRGELEDITVVGYEGNRSILETPGSVSYVDAELIGAFDESSLLYGLNTVPGVRIEQRAPGSYRVAIRGSSLRSPYGVRNVKVYWNGIPFTEPTGNTPLNLLDVQNMKKVEVIRGPAGSIYGAGNGGVLLINSLLPSDNSYVQTNLSTGSYGAYKYTFDYHTALPNGTIAAKYASQHSDGYRAQSFFDRKVFEVSGNVDFTEDRNLMASFLYTDLNYGIPGGLNKEQFEQNPRQARPGNPFALGSEEADASIDQEGLLITLKHDYQATEKYKISAAAYGTFTQFENPFNLDYKRDSRKSGGLRSIHTYDTEIGGVRTKFNLGTETGRSSYVARNFGNDSGQPDTLNFDDELKVKESLIFSSVEVDLPAEFYITAGLSYNYLRYDINRLVTNLEGDEPRRVVKKFDAQIVPRVGLAKKLSRQVTLHGSVSLGFSPPTIEEVRTNEGSINLNLEPEKGTNYEAGIRGYTPDGRFNFDVTSFYFKLDETIIQQQSDRGTVLFENAGNTDQFGIEAVTNWLLIEEPTAFLSRLNWKMAYTWHHFRFGDYVKEGNDYSGNELTGVAPNIVVTSLDAQTEPGLYGVLSYNFTDEIPLNDANTVYSDAYHLVQTKLGFRTDIKDKWSLDIHAGIDNLLDESYSLGYDINAFGGRYYQPAAKRNWFAGVKVNYQLGN